MNYNSLQIISLNCGFIRFNPLNYNETYFELDSEEATVCTYCGSGFILFMYVYRAFDTSHITNNLLKCNLTYWFKLYFISFDTFDMVLYYIHTTLQDSIQHAAWTFDTSDIPWILQNLLFLHTRFWQESFLHISNH